jgi:hypothetical protein
MGRVSQFPVHPERLGVVRLLFSVPTSIVKTREGRGFRANRHLRMERLTISGNRGTLLLTSFPLPAYPLWSKNSS